MRVDKKMCKVIADLEFLIGSECYNPKSYDGWNDIEGCAFRYPVNIPKKDGEYAKVRSNANQSASLNSQYISPASISHMKYQFGSNELFIGNGLISVLNYLEERYNIDFNELEEQK